MMTFKEIQREAALYLSRYQVAKAEVKDIQRRIERAESEMMSIKGISYEGGDMPKAHNTEHDLSDYFVRIDDLLHDWETAQKKAITIMREVSATIEAVDYDQARRVLMLHFIDNYTYEEIAEIMDRSVESVYRWRRIGLAKIIIKPDSL
jgi:DNA-directed RNA polymerase specialized sigma24 family protein